MLEDYPFLELLSAQTAAMRGANLDDKVNHAVYSAIQHSSTLANVKANTLFTLEESIQDIVNLDRAELKRVIRRLILDKLVIQIFRLDFHSADSSIRLVPCFIANSVEGKDLSFELYSRVQQRSIQALESFLDSRPALNADEYRAALEADFNSAERLSPQELSSVVTDFFAEVHPGRFELMPDPSLLEVTRREIRDSLVRRARVVEIVDYGFMPLRQAEIMERLEIAAEFMKRKLMPRYKNKGDCKRELEKVSLDEANYRLDPFAPSTAEFDVARAQAVRRAGLSGAEGARFPGMLAVNIIIALENHTREPYREKLRKQQEEEVREFKRGLLETSGDWRDSIRFLDNEAMEEFAPEVRKILVEDLALLHSVWNIPQREIHVFCRDDPSLMRVLFENMEHMPVSERWKILALRALLEKYELRPPYRALFEDPEFIRQYGRTLRNAYMNQIPWYLRILLWLGITLFQNYSFNIAKQRINVQQKLIRDANRKLGDERVRRREAELLEQRGRLKELARANLITEAMDRSYFTSKRLPIIRELKKELAQECTPDEFDAIFEAENFRKIPHPTDPNPNSGAALYPLNHEWRSRAVRLRKVLGEVGSQPGEEREKKDREAMIRKIERSFTQGGSSGSSGHSSEGSKDPYEVFEQELHKHEKRERKEKGKKEIPVSGNSESEEINHE